MSESIYIGLFLLTFVILAKVIHRSGINEGKNAAMINIKEEYANITEEYKNKATEFIRTCITENKAALNDLQKKERELTLNLDKRHRELILNFDRKELSLRFNLKEKEREALQQKQHFIAKEEQLTEREEQLTSAENNFNKLLKEAPILECVAEQVQAYIFQNYDMLTEYYLLNKPRPALKAAETVSIANKEKRHAIKELQMALNQIKLYELYAPWLAEYTETPIGELIESYRNELQECANMDEDDESIEDPIERYVPKTEWYKLTIPERNQLALDRYLSSTRKRSAWSAGVQYERYVGYVLEQKGYRVEYQGAIKGKSDFGIDLVARKGGNIWVIQCKRLSVEKGLPVRENTVAQTYGSAIYYKLINKIEGKVMAMIVTTYELSNEAKHFAKHLGVSVKEHIELKPYPVIKCNVARQTNEKIYHLPMDQAYDKTIIEPERDEFYAMTVAEAEDKGFRRAFRWQGNKE